MQDGRQRSIRGVPAPFAQRSSVDDEFASSNRSQRVGAQLSPTRVVDRRDPPRWMFALLLSNVVDASGVTERARIVAATPLPRIRASGVPALRQRRINTSREAF